MRFLWWLWYHNNQGNLAKGCIATLALLVATNGIVLSWLQSNNGSLDPHELAPQMASGLFHSLFAQLNHVPKSLDSSPISAANGFIQFYPPSNEHADYATCDTSISRPYLCIVCMRCVPKTLPVLLMEKLVGGAGFTVVNSEKRTFCELTLNVLEFCEAGARFTKNLT